MSGLTLNIRPAHLDDWPAIWSIIEPIFRAGETYAVDEAISETEAQFWITAPYMPYVACDAATHDVLGTYFVKPNKDGRGAHIANCGYAVAAAAQGRGVARAMCLHSLSEAKRMDYRGMQFNAVISTNTAAIHLWKSCGFDIVGTLPNAFHHPTQGYVDAFVMFQSLTGETT